MAHRDREQIDCQVCQCHRLCYIFDVDNWIRAGGSGLGYLGHLGLRARQQLPYKLWEYINFSTNPRISVESFKA